MADGPPFSDDERIVLMLIWKHHEELAWHQATKVFNTVFNHQHRSHISLFRAWHSRHHDNQMEVWNRLLDKPRAGHDLATRKKWLQTINTAVEQLDGYTAVQQLDINPERLHRRSEQRSARVQWDDEMRLVLHLLVPDPTLDPRQRTVVFNALFRDVLAGQGVASVSEEKINSHWSRRKEKRKDNQGRQADGAKLTTVEKWQRIIDGPQTREEQANVARWKKAIKEQKISLGYLPAPNPSKKSQQVEEKIRERKPKGNQGEPSFNMHENVGDWHFGCRSDWDLARTKLGGRLTGMPAIPSAADVQRLREQTKRVKRPDTWTEGIHIFPGAETVNWASLDPNEVYGLQQRGQGVSSSKPARLEDSGNGVPATAVGDSSEETTAAAVGTEDNIQENGPEDGRAAQEGGGVVASAQYRFQVQQAVIDHLHRSGPEDAAEVQRLFQQYNRSTLDLANASLLFLRVNQALQNLKRR